jgi:hypothetical protein
MEYESPISYPPVSQGGLRRLTLGEVHLASSVYGFSIQYNKDY